VGIGITRDGLIIKYYNSVISFKSRHEQYSQAGQVEIQGGHGQTKLYFEKEQKAGG